MNAAESKNKAEPFLSFVIRQHVQLNIVYDNHPHNVLKHANLGDVQSNKWLWN